MANACSICSHPNRLDIDREIVNNVPHLRIAKRYNLTDTAVRNHSIRHLSRQLLKSTEIAEKLETSRLLDLVENCLSKTQNILAEAEKAGKHGLQLQALREIRGTVQMMASWAISFAQLQIDQQNNGGSGSGVITVPAITDDMEVKDAEKLFRNFLLQMNNRPPGSPVVLLPEKQNIIDDYQPIEEQTEDYPEEPEQQPTRKKRTRLPPGNRSTEPVEQVPDEESEEAELERIELERIEEAMAYIPPPPREPTRPSGPSRIWGK